MSKEMVYTGFNNKIVIEYEQGFLTQYPIEYKRGVIGLDNPVKRKTLNKVKRLFWEQSNGVIRALHKPLKDYYV